MKEQRFRVEITDDFGIFSLQKTLNELSDEGFFITQILDSLANSHGFVIIATKVKPCNSTTTSGTMKYLGK